MVSRTKKLRGSRTHGRGKKHGRGHGEMGGHGNAGLHKHKFKWMILHDPDHFGAYGFVRHAATKPEKLAVNVGDIEDRFAEFESKGALHRSDAGYKLDLTIFGIDKLLGAGRANVPIEVIVAEATESAKAKIEASGGKVITIAQEKKKGN